MAVELQTEATNYVLGAEANQFQPNGVDIRVGKVMVLKKDAEIEFSEVLKVSSQLNDIVDEVNVYEDENGKYVVLKPGFYYLFDAIETAKLTADVSGLLKQRSSCNRGGMRIESGWWDSGYEGGLGGSITVAIKSKLYLGTRVAQLILFDSETEKQYDGQWQGTNSTAEPILG